MLAILKKMLTFVAPFLKKCPDGGIGRRVGLKHQCLQGLAGSIPALGTKKEGIRGKVLQSITLILFFCK